MSRVFRTPWVLFPIVLTIVFAALFVPVVWPRYALPTALLLTVVGICVLWASYLVRGRIFSRWENDEAERECGNGT